MANRFYLLIFLVFLPFLIFQLITFTDYGMHWDEGFQIHLGQATLDFIQGKTKTIELAKDDLIYYGSFFEVFNLISANFLIANLGLAYIDAFHVLTFLAVLSGFALLFLFAKKLFSLDAAFYSLFFLLLHPRFLAHGHYNSKDIPIAVFSLISFFFLYKTAVEKKLVNPVLAGLFTGLTLALQVTTMQILLVYFSAYITYLLFLKTIGLTNLRQAIKTIISKWGIFFLVLIATTYLFWPALWLKPSHFFDSITYFLNHGWPGSVLYFGKVYKGAEVPWHYPFVYILITTPIITLICLAFGFNQALKNIRRKEKSLEYLLLLSWLFIPLLIASKPGTVKYDGVRHFLIVLPPLAVLAGIGLTQVLNTLRKRLPKNYQVLTLSLLLISSAWLLYDSILISPYGGSYFNQGLRLFIPENIENVLEIEYWGTTYRSGVEWLNQYAGKNSSFCAPIAPHLIQFYPRREDLKFQCGQDTDYLMFFTRKAVLPANLAQKSASIEPVFKISRYHSDLLYIYKVR